MKIKMKHKSKTKPVMLKTNYLISVSNKAKRILKKQGVPYSPFLVRNSGKFHSDVSFLIHECKENHQMFLEDLEEEVYYDSYPNSELEDYIFEEPFTHDD